MRHLRPEGVLVANFVNGGEFRHCALNTVPALRRRLAAVFSLTSVQNENRVGVFARFPATSAGLRRRLRQHPQLAAALAAGRLRYRIRARA
ncbi:MAG TPA: hypothetical protein ENK12_00840 [Gammaproteobacteria bacterium]|nr:hypothetical protein [Gammaproteobacteria bacterium]